MRNITWITGMPRSGTSWIAQVFASSPSVRLKLCPLFSYAFKNTMDGESSPEEWTAFFDSVYSTQDKYMDQEFLRRDGSVPCFMHKAKFPEHLVIKSTRFHNLTRSLLEKHPSIRFLAVVRHPCATIHSWLTNPLEFPESEIAEQQWRSGKCRKTGPGEFWGFNDWKTVTAMHLSLETAYPKRFILLRYENMVLNAKAVTRELFKQLAIHYTRQTDRFLDTSQSLHSQNKRSVFKSPTVKDRWRNELSKSLSQVIIDEVTGTPLERFLKE